MNKTRIVFAVVMLANFFTLAEGTISVTNGEDQGFAIVIQSLEKTGGQLTPTLRAMYLGWAEQVVSNQLTAAKFSVPADCWSEVQSDSMLRDAMFGAVYPPDGSILRNYARLRNALGVNFLNKYRSLVIAAAVATRTKGVMTNDYSAPQKTKKNNLLDYFGEFEEDLQPNEADDNQQLIHAIADFMKTDKISALNLYQSQEKQQQLFQFLKNQNLDKTLIARAEKHLGSALMGSMIVLGQRPVSREPEPDLATWLLYLASVYEATPSSKPSVGKKNEQMPWPLFPMDKCPWPLLMPLSQTMPIGEARYIWETFQGEHGPKRYHNYGPYRSRQTELLYELQPSPWHWDSWQDRIVHGGVCVVMAMIALDNHRALCEPAIHAGQPHHANLIAYHNVGGVWAALIEQSFAGGPDVTHAAWLFQDGETAPRLMSPNRCGSEYHLGLAAGMNIGLRQYIDTRIAVNLFNALPDTDKKTNGVTLLNQAIQTNPFNPAPWYLLAKQNSGNAWNLLASKTASINMAEKINKRRASNDMGGILGKNNSQFVEIQVQRYWQTVAEFLTNPMRTRKTASHEKDSERNQNT